MKIQNTKFRTNPLLVGTLVLIFSMFFSAHALAQSAGGNPTGPPPVIASTQTAALQNHIAVMEKRVKELSMSRTMRQNTLSNLEEQRDAFVKQLTKAGVSSDSYPEIMKTLQNQRIQLVIDIAGLDARIGDIEKVRATNEQNMATELFAPLSEIIEIAEIRLAKAQQLMKKGSVPQSEVQKCKSQLLTAKVELAKSKQSPRQSRLDEELTNATLERSEKRARLEKIAELVGAIIPSQRLITELNKTERSMKANEDQFFILDEEFKSAKFQIDMLKNNLEAIKNDKDLHLP